MEEKTLEDLNNMDAELLEELLNDLSGHVRFAVFDIMGQFKRCLPSLYCDAVEQAVWYHIETYARNTRNK